MAMGQYVGTVLPIDPMVIAVSTVLVVTALHAIDLDVGGAFQVGATLIKVAVILFYVLAGLAAVRETDSLPLAPSAASLDAIFSAPFGLSLIYVSYAYSGWNAVAYVVDEVRDPQRIVPRALVRGTLAVTALYLLLNLTFLRTTGLDELAGTVEVGAVSARNIFGERGALVLSLLLSLLLVSTISAMVLTGPRVLARIGEDLPTLRFLSARNRRGAPTRAVLLQQGLALVFIVTGSFEGVLTFAGFTLTLFALLTVAGVLRLRQLEPGLPRPFKVPFYPLPPLVFLVASGLSLLFVAGERPYALLAVSALLLAGWVLVRRSPAG
jgi:APA family basic amino acid/polyamine antiporter